MSREEVGLETTVGAGARGQVDTDDRSRSIGPYRLQEKIGAGGMGEVWLAEQQKPIQRQVALKIIKLGMDTSEIVARFESERQALAMMSHPAIAQVFDAGSTQEGRPFFVMEFIPGVPITQYCDRHQLSIRERLALFTQVCAGVQHAHHKAIIHRDLKPGNVLVASQDGKATPKIIDFGIAKAIGEGVDEKTQVTEVGTFVGTLEYMSPEQADLTSQDVDTRTDVYSLGVILYELLTGVRPLELKSGPGRLAEVLRTIQQEEPKRPSVRTATLDHHAEMAQQRHTSVTGLVRELSTDLDWITMKALEKDRSRRYNSPADLAADIDRFLTNQPIVARPPSKGYRAGRFVRRHRFGVAVASAAALVLVAFVVTMAVQARRIAQERDRASEQAQRASEQAQRASEQATAKERIAEFMKDLFRVPDPSRTRGNEITAREILDQGARKIENSLNDQPTARADLIQTMGEVYESLGLYGDAERLTRKALDIRKANLGDNNPATVESISSLAHIARQQRRFDEAADLNKRALDAETLLYGAEDRRTLRSQEQLANIYTLQGKLSEATALFETVLPIQRRVVGDDDHDTIAALNDLAILYNRQNLNDKAITLFKEILDRRRRVLGEDHPDTLSAVNNLAYCYQEAGRYAEGRQLLENAVPIGKQVWSATHPYYGILLNTRGELEMAAGDFDSAERYLAKALEIYSKQPGGVEHLPDALVEMAQVSVHKGKTDAAIRYLADAVAKDEKHQKRAEAIAKDTKFASLHSNPRFSQVIAR